MRAILISAKERMISEVENPGDWKWLGEQVKGWITTALILVNQDRVYVNDEGLINGTTDFTIWDIGREHKRAFAGNCVIIGCDPGGETLDALSDIEDIEQMIQFADINEVKELIRMGRIE